MVIYILLILFFLAIFFVYFVFKHKLFKKEKIQSIDEITDYTETATLYEDEEKLRSQKEENTKFANSGYQPKAYRGTDIEIAGFESVKDLKALQRDEVLKVGSEDLHKVEEKKKIVEPFKPQDLEVEKSGIGSKKAALQKVQLEVKQNYQAKGENSALDNFKHSIEEIKNSGGRGR